MKYITGTHALNLQCSLDTCGDWHTSALKWVNIQFKNSDTSRFKDWGIESGHEIPDNDGVYYVANHIRALLDLLEDGKFSVARGMREDFICNEMYTPMVLEMVWELRDLAHWESIDKFMKREYRITWLEFKERIRDGTERLAN